MIFLFTALYAEAYPFINYFKLKRDLQNNYFQVFSNDEALLTVTGVGKINSAIAVAYTLGRYGIYRDSFALNFGIAGSKFPQMKGHLYLINKVIDSETKKVFVPDVLVDHSFEESDLETFNHPVKDAYRMEANLCDMEGSGFYQAASKFFDAHQIYLLKLVSDSLDFEGISRDFVIQLVEEKLKEIDEFIKMIKESFKTEEVFSEEEKNIIKTLSDKLKLTTSQRKILYKACLHYKVRENKGVDFLKGFFGMEVTNKKEREKAFEEVLSHLR